MPLTDYTCRIAGGCGLLVPNNPNPSPCGATGQGAAPQPLGVALAIPTLNVPAGTNPGNRAIRVRAQGSTFCVWAAGGNVRWVNQNILGAQMAGPAANGNRCFNLWLAGGAVNFSVT